MKRILIVKTSAIGDVITSFDAVSYLHARYPEVKIDWVVEKPSATLLAAHPHIDRVLICNTKAWRKSPLSKENRAEMGPFFRELRKEEYDVLFDLQGNTKSAVFTAAARAKHKVGFSLKTLPEKPNALVTNRRYPIPKQGPVRKRYLDLIQAYFQDSSPFTALPITLSITSAEEERLSQLMNTLGDSPRLMLAMGSNWKNKQLCEKVAADVLCRIDAKLNPTFFFPYGNEAERRLGETLAAPFGERGIVIGEMSLPFWQALMSRMMCVMTMDSAALHLCGTTATPSFSLFGPSLASVYKPPGAAHGCMQGQCPYNVSFAMRCPRLRTCPTRACMQNYTAEEIAEQFNSFLQASLESSEAPCDQLKPSQRSLVVGPSQIV